MLRSRFLDWISKAIPSWRVVWKEPLADNSNSAESSVIKRNRIFRKPNMLVPRNIFFVWVNEVTKSEKTRSLSFLFQAPTVEYSSLSLRRPCSEPFVQTTEKIIEKVSKLPSKLQSSDGAFEILPVNTTKYLEKTVEEVLNECDELSVNGDKWRVVRNAVDVSGLACQLKPIVGCPIVPAYDILNDLEGVAKAKIHWFVLDASSGKPQAKKSKGEETNVTLFYDNISPCGITVANGTYRETSDEYIPCEDDIGKKLVVVVALGPLSVVRYCVSRYVVEKVDEDLLCTHWRSFTESTPQAGSLRVLSYNILADLYLNLKNAQEDLFFPYCLKEYQEYNYRYSLLLKELTEYKFDIAFLQEVDDRFFKRYLRILNARGVDMLFQKKGAQVSEGSVIAYKRDKFSVVRTSCNTLAELIEDPVCESMKELLMTSEEAWSLFVTRPTALQVVALRHNESGKVLLCANSHFHHNPRHEYIKAAQAYVSMQHVLLLMKELKDELSCDVHVLFGADMNSTPDGSVYELLSTGVLSAANCAWMQDEKLRAHDVTISQPLDNLTGCPEYTNYTRYKNSKNELCGFAGCLDYVWAHNMKMTAIAPRPSHEAVARYGALPSKISPSDHLPLLVDVKFC